MKKFLKKTGLVSAVAAGSLVAGMATVQPAMAGTSDDPLEQRIMQLQ